ncbi:hypothetical protein [Shewanella subflava]|uniref:Uncharacterized protein n=1 Tax=Shewanella subflava TaxID=2986476 RepID=A0ABT3I5R4_9GAMM|nr:hypothetical protein [Shewanella subflava]MCW3171397.1 hypothetical protein [Shewanella subflava]
MNQQLTPKQISQRKYYEANKATICASKRAQYQAVSKVSPSAKAVFNTTINVKKAVKVRKNAMVINSTELVDAVDTKAANQLITEQEKAKAAARRKREDILMARELGISLEDFV